MGEATERPIAPAADGNGGDRSVRSAAGALALVARYHGVPCDAGQLAREWLPAATPDVGLALQRAARRLGLRARCRRDARARLARLPLPALVCDRDGGWLVLAAQRVGRRVSVRS